MSWCQNEQKSSNRKKSSYAWIMPLQAAIQGGVCHHLYMHRFNMALQDDQIDLAGGLGRETAVAPAVRLAAVVADEEEDVPHQVAS